MSEKIRIRAAKDRILEILKSAGARGETTWGLINATHHSAAARRVWELQHAHVIEKQYEGCGVYRWIYIGPKQQPSLLAMMGGA